MIAAQVECHSGYTYADRPRAFKWEGERVVVEVVESEWQTPKYKHFIVRSEQNQLFELIYEIFFWINRLMNVKFLQLNIILRVNLCLSFYYFGGFDAEIT